MAPKKRMPIGFFKDIYGGTKQLDHLLLEDPAGAKELSEVDVVRIMKAKPVTIRTHADGTRNLIWQQSRAAIGIVFTSDHRFNGIYYRTGV